jgi:hypothetical protein
LVPELPCALLFCFDSLASPPSLHASFKSQNLPALAQGVTIIRPPRHHSDALISKIAAEIGSAHVIVFNMGEFDVRWRQRSISRFSFASVEKVERKPCAVVSSCE